MNPPDTRTFVSFSISDHCFGLCAAEVEEVVMAPEITEIPLAPRYLSGLINLRGQILAALRGSVLLGLPENGGESVSLILRLKSGLVGLQVDRIGEVLQVDPETCESVPGNLSPVLKKFLKGICRNEGRLLLELDGSALEPATLAEINRN